MKNLLRILAIAAITASVFVPAHSATLRGAENPSAVHLRSEEQRNAINAPVYPSSPVVQTQFGPVRGYLKDGVYAFLGIPFGKHSSLAFDNGG